MQSQIPRHDMRVRLIRLVAALLGAALLLVTCWLVAISTLPPSVLYWTKIRQVESYVEQIEKYRRDHGRYPDEQQQTIVPRDEAGNPYFYKGGGSGYEVGFTVGFDEEYVFSSTTKRWSFESPPP